MAELERVLLPQPRQNQSMRQKIYVLCGSGGTGKTQLAVEFAWRYHHHFTSVFWLDGCSEDTLKRSIASCTGRIPQGQIPETSRGYATGSSVDIDVVVKDVIAWLAQPDNTAWLLIFDNVNRDYMYDRKRYLPGADHGSVLVTTRQAPLKQLGESQCLGKVSSKQGQAILKTWYKGEQDTTESAVLVAQLDRSPLVIVQAGAYLQQSGVKPQTYLELYEQRWNASIISNNLADVQLSFLERRVWITSAISYEAIRYRHRATANLLLLWSFLDNKDLWHGLFAATCNRSTEAAAMLSRWLGDIASSETEFNVAMQLLCSYALVEEVKETAGKISYTACPLVHHWTYHSQGKRFEKELGRLAVVAVGWAVPESSTGDYDTLRRLLPHVKACSDHMKKNEIAWHERAEGGSDGKKEEDKEQKTVLDAMHFVHDLLFNQGNLGTAKQIYELRSDSYHVGKFSFGGLLFSGKSMGARVRYSKTTKAKQPQDEIDDRLLLDD
ncbi:hypothetical protein COCC4DRAFT_193724 [Bipolaris maydis ATCC 48331]|uniref:NB-ARC domain-containing protein n=2 Tax=Cochliobolus heterostrophus TaxID=5016 RepID=N4X076_COCH4|nr:uncharacterized protein COCC4DRAFT_193724 [Bipolaris maydis ATCC 48331]ENI06354.1 hypothetical protein COCC4DRAFT_193724 [Bipolaris maydis ATCC 48331]KAJ6275222.1 hypothetical protein PSV08DRAFT_196130 [Bipolaris maydis]KAJ6285488.1 hypothetical protein J3E71DRAFT_389015 [Bipolaris maydis]